MVVAQVFLSLPIRCPSCCTKLKQISIACARCQSRRKACTYNRDSLVLMQSRRQHPVRNAAPLRSNVPAPSPAPALGACSLESLSTIETPSTTDPGESKHSDDDQDQDQEQSRPHYVAQGHFAGEVAAAIEVRAGLSPVATSTLVAFVDAPLFGDVDVHHPSSSPHIHGPLDLAAQLPPRALADRLVDIYWQHIHYVEVILDRERFFRNYETSYSRPNALLHLDLDVWLSTLNAIFALSVQRQESISLQKRNEDGNRYFQRAIALLHSDTIFWKPASLELVQCLVLTNRYLQCTKNPQKTWMTAGLAIQMARSVCFHPLDTTSAKESTSDKWMRQRVWAGCVALDR
jgi:hypothetical protein